MSKLVLFWTLRVLAIIFPLFNIIFFKVDGVWGVIALIFGCIACVNLYIWGLFCRETNKKAPGLFILFRVLQALVVFIFDALPVSYFLTAILMDAVFYAIWLYDSRYMFVYREPRDGTNSKIRQV